MADIWGDFLSVACMLAVIAINIDSLAVGIAYGISNMESISAK